VVNAFFLVNGILQSIPSISTNSPLATLVPLAFVVILGVIKEAVAEIKRWQEDRAFNSTQAREVKFDKEHQIIPISKRLDQIKVGDILEVVDGEQIPADCVILCASDPKGKAFIQTA